MVNVDLPVVATRAAGTARTAVVAVVDKDLPVSALSS